MHVRNVCVFAIAVLLSSHSTNALAALDLIPAPFRGQEGTVFASWDFKTPDNPENADLVSFVPLPGATLTQLYPSAELLNLAWIQAGVDGGWYGLPGSIYGLPDGGIINISMPNFIDFEPLKELWIQIAYLPGAASPYVAAIEASDNVEGQVFGVLNGAVDYTQDGYRVESWSIVPNPDLEMIQIFVPYAVFVDSVVVDTISVPEVPTLALSAAGLFIAGTLVIRRRSAMAVRA